MSTDAERLAEHWGAMLRSAHGVLGSRDEAEECAGQALVQACERNRDDVLNMEAFLVTVTKRRAIDRLRQLERGRRLDARLAGQRLPHVPDVAEDVTRQAEARWMAQEAERVLRPAVFCLLRRVADGEPLDGVARDLEMTESAARTQLYRARQLLRDVYQRTLL